MFGDGAVRTDFLRRRDQLHLKNVSHYPLQERALLPHMLNGADAVLVSQLAEVVDIVVPSKLVTAMGAGAIIQLMGSLYASRGIGVLAQRSAPRSIPRS